MATKDNRKIIQGVQIPEADEGVVGSALRSFHPGQEDELEKCMTPGQCAHLKACGAIEGDWEAKGELPLPMAGSKAEKAATMDFDKQKATAKKLDDLAKKRADARMAENDAAEAAAGKEQKDVRRELHAQAAAPKK